MLVRFELITLCSVITAVNNCGLLKIKVEIGDKDPTWSWSSFGIARRRSACRTFDYLLTLCTKRTKKRLQSSPIVRVKIHCI